MVSLVPLKEDVKICGSRQSEVKVRSQPRIKGCAGRNSSSFLHVERSGTQAAFTGPVFPYTI
jgi:hypothetical protein